MKKRYTLDPDIVCHVFKSGTRNDGTIEPNDGAGGHAVQDIKSKITEYKIDAIPREKRGGATNWLAAAKDVAILCPFAHVATFKLAGQAYIQKSMFPGNVTKAELIKTIERALTSPTSSHCYNGFVHKNKVSLPTSEFERQLSDNVIEGGYVLGRANGIRIKGQTKGADKGALTSAFPDTTNFFWG